MVSVYLHQGGKTSCLERIDPAWLQPASGVTVWVDLAAPTAEEGGLRGSEYFAHHIKAEDMPEEFARAG